jgi:D-lactate dehydrogenase
VTAPLAEGFDAVCPFVNDRVDAATVAQLAAGGTRLLTLRSAGFNHVDLDAAEAHGLTVVRVPAYSPYAVAEHTVALMLGVERKIHRASNRVRDGNFSLEGLLGFDLRNKRIGIIGTGRIGQIVARIMRGFGCSIRAYDPVRNDDVRDLGVRYVDLDTLFAECDVITLHCPLTPETYHLIDEEALRKVRPGVMIVNTSRGR